jgi:hypothetical protein
MHEGFHYQRKASVMACKKRSLWHQMLGSSKIQYFEKLSPFKLMDCIKIKSKVIIKTTIEYITTLKQRGVALMDQTT